jgi:hypothetical protein
LVTFLRISELPPCTGKLIFEVFYEALRVVAVAGVVLVMRDMQAHHVLRLPELGFSGPIFEMH